jgi:hypothetical protein
MLLSSQVPRIKISTDASERNCADGSQEVENSVSYLADR